MPGAEVGEEEDGLDGLAVTPDLRRCVLPDAGGASTELTCGLPARRGPGSTETKAALLGLR